MKFIRNFLIYSKFSDIWPDKAKNFCITNSWPNKLKARLCSRKCFKLVPGVESRRNLCFLGLPHFCPDCEIATFLESWNFRIFDSWDFRTFGSLGLPHFSGTSASLESWDFRIYVLISKSQISFIIFASWDFCILSWFLCPNTFNFFSKHSTFVLINEIFIHIFFVFLSHQFFLKLLLKKLASKFQNLKFLKPFDGIQVFFSNLMANINLKI